MSKTTLDVLIEARAIYERCGVPRHPLNHEVCLMTALSVAAGATFGKVTPGAWRGAFDHVNDLCDIGIPAFNDGHTKAENLAILDKAIENERARLARDAGVNPANTVAVAHHDNEQAEVADRIGPQVQSILNDALAGATAQAEPAVVS